MSASPTIRVGGATVAYSERPAGDGLGIPLVLAHGAESDKAQFASFMPLLDRRIRVITYDQRDTGESLYGTTPYTMADLGDDLADLVQALDLPGAHVLGTSFGGAIALHAALRHPELVRSLTLVATSPSHAAVEAQTTPPAALPTQDRTRFMLDAAVSEQARAADPTLLARVQDALTTRPATGRHRRRAALRSHDVADRLGSITTPTLVIHGTHDPLVPAGAATMVADGVPNAHLILLERARHGVLFEHEATIAELVSQFVLEGEAE